MAAGRGTRLGRLGTYLQKCMYPVGLRPFLELTLAEAAAAGGERVHLVVGHLGEQVRAYFGSSFAGMELVYVEQEEPNGTGAALGLVAPSLARALGSVVVWQADVHVPRRVFEAVAGHRSPNAVTLVDEPDAPRELLATVVADAVSRVWGGVGPYSDGGVWKLEPRLLAALGGPSGARAGAGEVRALPNLQRLIDAGEARVGAVVAGERLHLGGTHPTPEENVVHVVSRLLGGAGDP